MCPTSLKSRLKDEARTLGLDDLGVAAADPTLHLTFYRWWLGAGDQGGMAYLSRNASVARRVTTRLKTRRRFSGIPPQVSWRATLGVETTTEYSRGSWGPWSGGWTGRRGLPPTARSPGQAWTPRQRTPSAV